MYELIKVSNNCYYIDCPSKIGIIKVSEDKAVLIDSGNNREVGKKIKKTLDECGFRLLAIYNTHSHADHIGANKYLQNLTGCKVYAKGIECDFTNHPILESTYIYGGFSPKDLHRKFLLAEASEAEDLTGERLPSGIELIDLPGHSFDMVGFRSADGIVYLGDCLSSKETLDKYGIGFIYDVGAYIQTLEKVKEMEARLFIPSHAEPCEDIHPLADYNINKVKEIADKIVSFCDDYVSIDALLKKLFDEYSMTMTFEQHALVGSTVRSYLAYLKDNGRLEVNFENNMMRWRAIKQEC